MNKVLKNLSYSLVGVALVSVNSITQAMNFGSEKVQTWVKWTNNTVDVAAQNLIWTLATFLTIIAVIYALYGWFNILTAGWAEDSVKKWKTILIQALIWLVVIWLSYSIVSWLITLILPSA